MLKKTTGERIKELEAELADLLSRWPAHSVSLHLWQQREELEEELEKLKKESGEH